MDLFHVLEIFGGPCFHNELGVDFQKSAERIRHYENSRDAENPEKPFAVLLLRSIQSLLEGEFQLAFDSLESILTSDQCDYRWRLRGLAYNRLLILHQACHPLFRVSSRDGLSPFLFLSSSSKNLDTFEKVSYEAWITTRNDDRLGQYDLIEFKIISINWRANYVGLHLASRMNARFRDITKSEELSDERLWDLNLLEMSISATKSLISISETEGLSQVSMHLERLECEIAIVKGASEAKTLLQDLGISSQEREDLAGEGSCELLAGDHCFPNPFAHSLSLLLPLVDSWLVGPICLPEGKYPALVCLNKIPMNLAYKLDESVSERVNSEFGHSIPLPSSQAHERKWLDDLTKSMEHYEKADRLFRAASATRAIGAVVLRKACLKIVNRKPEPIRKGDSDGIYDLLAEASELFRASNDTPSLRLLQIIAFLTSSLQSDWFQRENLEEVRKWAYQNNAHYFIHMLSALALRYAEYHRYRTGEHWAVSRGYEVVNTLLRPDDDEPSLCESTFVAFLHSKSRYELAYRVSTLDDTFSSLVKRLPRLLTSISLLLKDKTSSAAAGFILEDQIEEIIKFAISLYLRDNRTIGGETADIKALNYYLEFLREIESSEENDSTRLPQVSQQIRDRSLASQLHIQDWRLRGERMLTLVKLVASRRVWIDSHTTEEFDFNAKVGILLNDLSAESNDCCWETKIMAHVSVGQFEEAQHVINDLDFDRLLTRSNAFLPRLEPWRSGIDTLRNVERIFNMTVISRHWKRAIELKRFLAFYSPGYFHSTESASDETLWRRCYLGGLVEENNSGSTSAFELFMRAFSFILEDRAFRGLSNPLATDYHPDIDRMGVYSGLARLLIRSKEAEISALRLGEQYSGRHEHAYQLFLKQKDWSPANHLLAVIWVLELARPPQLLCMIQLNGSPPPTWIRWVDYKRSEITVTQAESLLKDLSLEHQLQFVEARPHLEDAWHTYRTYLDEGFSTTNARKYWLSDMSLDNMVKVIPEDALAICIHTSKDGLVVIGVNSAGPIGARYDANVQLGQIEDMLHRFSSLLEQSIQHTSEESKSEILVLSESVSTMLILPFEEEIREKSHVIFIPSGPFNQVSFGILRFDNEWLILKKAVSQAPSLSVLAEMEIQSKIDLAEGSLQMDNVSVIARPGNFLEELSPRGEAALPLAGVEALLVAFMHEEDRKIEVMNAQQVSRHMFKEQVKKDGLLHLCTHGYVNRQWPLFSQISLSDRMEVVDMLNVRTKAYMAVFSACHAGAGRYTTDDGVLGFPHTVLATGVKIFLGALWAANDLATLFHMYYFHLYLASHSGSESIASSWHHATKALYYTTVKKAHGLLLDFMNYWLLLQLEGRFPGNLVQGGFQELENALKCLTKIDGTPVIDFQHPSIWGPFVLVGLATLGLKNPNFEEFFKNQTAPAPPSEQIYPTIMIRPFRPLEIGSDMATVGDAIEKVIQVGEEYADVAALPLYFQLKEIPTLSFGDLEVIPRAWGGYIYRKWPAGRTRDIPKPFEVGTFQDKRQALMRRCVESVVAIGRDGWFHSYRVSGYRVEGEVS